MDNQLDPLVGRDGELERVIQILCRRTKNNPVLIGEPGVGKTAIVEGLAQRIADGEVPSFLADKRVLALDLSLIVAGTKYRGQFEERLKTIMKELMENQNSIVFIDELHTLVGAGSAEGSLDAANILKPALSRGEIQCIGATTPAEYPQVHREGPLARAPLPGRQSSAAERSRRHQDHHGHQGPLREVPRGQLHRCGHRVRRLALQPLHPDRFLPDKAIDLIDEAGARVKLRQTSLPEEITEVQKRIKFIVHRMGLGDREPRVREGALLLGRRAQGAREPARPAREVSPRRLGRRHRRPRRHRRRGQPLDRRPRHLDQGRRDAEAAPRGRRAAQARHLAGEGHLGAGPRHPPFARRPQVANRPIGSASSSSDRPASAKPKWRAPWRKFLFGSEKRSSASICRSSWRSTRSRS
jgi:hypothetical protein